MFINKLKNNYLILICAIILVIIILFITVILSGTSSTQPSENQVPSPTPVSSNVPESTNPPYSLDKTATISLLNKISNPQPLSSNDEEAKSKILSYLPSGEVSGIVYQSKNVTVDYTRAANSFMGEITTLDINLAKKEATDWFLAQGMSLEGICNYPLQFYIGPQVSLELRGKNIVFNPLASECR